MQVIRVEDEEMNRIIESENLELLHPEYKTQPRVYYKNLYRFNKCFVGGSVAFKKDGIMDCAKGVEISLIKDSMEIDKILTDNFGDFKLDNLEERSGEYHIEIYLEGYDKKHLEINLRNSVNIGIVML